MTGPSKLSQQIVAVVLAHVGVRSNSEARNDAAVNVDALLAATPPETPSDAAMRAADVIADYVSDGVIGMGNEVTAANRAEFAAIITRHLAATPLPETPQINFSCRVCGVQCPSAPDPPARAICPVHCEDHDYRYERNERGHYCFHCGQQAPEDWYDD